MDKRFSGALLASISALALAAPALAETVETVVVTASKRAEPIREVPMAVTAITGNELNKLHATSFADFVVRVPGMTSIASDPSRTSLVLRGITTQGVGSTIGTYLDETPYGSSSALANGVITTPNLDTFDIERVEILRGPQGTLYGSSTLGGLLKFVTKAPDPSGFDDAIQIGGEDVDHGEAGGLVKGMVNIPLSDNAAFRATGYYSDQGGFIDDPVQGEQDVNGVRNLGGRASLLWNANADLSLRATVLVQNLDTDAGYIEDIVGIGGDGPVPLFGDLEQGRLATEYSDVRYRLYNATVDYDLGWADLTSATSWGTFDSRNLTDATNVYGLYVRANLGQEKLTQEVRLASPSSQSFEWLAGFYYTHETADLRQDLTLTPDSASLGFVELTSRFVETAGFANFTYHFSPAFDVSLGGRYAHNSQRADETGLALAAGGSEEDVFTWSVAPRWHASENTMVYARIAKGYRPGGPNALPPLSTGIPTTFDADSLVNYEIGVKSDLLDGRLSLDLDAFHIDWSDIQLLVVVQGFGINANGGTATSDGFEWSATWLPVDGLTLHFGGAYTDAHLTSGTDPILVGANSGDPLPYIPDWSASLDGDYVFAPMGRFTPYVGASWQYIGEREADLGSHLRLPSYGSFDLRAGVSLGNWSLEVYGKNIGDERGISSIGATPSFAAAQAAGVPFGGTVPTASVTRPRVVGITLTGKL